MNFSNLARIMITRLTCGICAYLVPYVATAATVDLCTQATRLINHPAEYVSEKVKKGGLKCLLRPTCCSPAWVSDPVCYVVQKKKVKDAWSETKEVTRCRTRSLNTGLKEFVSSWTSPTYVLSPSLMQAYRTYVDTMSGQGRSLPDDVQRYLLILVDRDKVPFTVDDITRARWMNASAEAAKPLTPRTWRQGQRAITHGNLIMVSGALSSATGCQRVALWAHEVTHVYQNRREGANAFTDKYLREAAQKSYEDISFEKEAFSVENRIESSAVCDMLGF